MLTEGNYLLMLHVKGVFERSSGAFRVFCNIEGWMVRGSNIAAVVTGGLGFHALLWVGTERDL